MVYCATQQKCAALFLAIALFPAVASAAQKTYINDQYGFSIDYPAVLKAVSPSRPSYAYLPPSLHNDDFVMVAEFAMPDGHSTIAGDDTRIYGALQISVGTSKAALAFCMSAADSDTELSHVRTEVINGNPFMAFDASMNALGNRFGERSFSTLHNHRCYNVRVIASGQFFDARPDVGQQEATEDAKRQGFPFSAYDIFSQLTPAIQTFRFTEKD